MHSVWLGVSACHYKHENIYKYSEEKTKGAGPRCYCLINSHFSRQLYIH